MMSFMGNKPPAESRSVPCRSSPGRFLSAPALLPQPKDLVNQPHHCRLFRLTDAALKFRNGAMQDFVHHAPGQGLNGLALLGGEASQPALIALHFAVADAGQTVFHLHRRTTP